MSAYAQGGAAAVSVLTEPSRFDGSLRALAAGRAALAALGMPTMRKDFLVDPYQVLEARAAGAGGVLLILRMLSRAQIAELLDAAAAHRIVRAAGSVRRRTTWSGAGHCSRTAAAGPRPSP